MDDELIGYTDPWSVRPGDRLRVMVSSAPGTVRVGVERLRHGDTNPDGPGFRATPVERPPGTPATVAGHLQIAHPGSWILVPAEGRLGLASFSLTVRACATLPDAGRPMGLLTRWSPARGGWGLFLDAQGRPELRLGAPDAPPLTAPRPLQRGAWYTIAAMFDATTGRTGLAARRLPARQPLSLPDAWSVHAAVPSTTTADDEALPLLLGAGWTATAGRRTWGEATLDGRLSAPALWDVALPVADLLAPGRVAAPAPLAAWDLGHAPTGRAIPDRGRLGLHGTTVNLPTRAVTGPDWSGDEHDPRHAPEQYDAIHLHSDDLEDAGWEPDVELTIPAGWRSGVYAVTLERDGATDRIPFIVRPPTGRATADLAVLLPTFTYLAYANERMIAAEGISFTDLTDRTVQPGPAERLLARHPEWGASLYDLHPDGTGISTVSRLRPIPNLRPDHRSWLTGAPRHLGADLYLVDWLEALGIPFDVLADDDLHAEGAALLAPYRCVATGSHPEYWTDRMRRGLLAFLGDGGRLMDLGGNGWYWVTSVLPDQPAAIEVRRGFAGTRAWESAPGELHHASTGELGGLWRVRGHAPNATVGVGFASQGVDTRAPGYTRTAAGEDPRAAFVFAGVEARVIGDRGLVMDGAAGDEIDRADDVRGPTGLGGPEHLLVLATSSGSHSRWYLRAHEEILVPIPDAGTPDPAIRADLVFFETPAGGAVFSTGSIGWLGGLSADGYRNAASRVTENVVRRFLDPAPFPLPGPG